MFLPAELKRYTKVLQFDMHCKAIGRDFDRGCEFLPGTYNGAAYMALPLRKRLRNFSR